MEIFIASTLLVAVAEIGDKTMLLAILLATRFKKPMPIIAGIFAATMANHALAAWAGSALASIFMSETFRIVQLSESCFPIHQCLRTMYCIAFDDFLKAYKCHLSA